MRVFSSIILCLLLVLAMGCQANPVEEMPKIEYPTTPLPGSTTEGGTTPMPPTLEVPMDAGLQKLIDKAVADLASRLSIPASEIKLIEAKPVVWPDASLGCPQPGMKYIQVPQDGLLVRLEANGQIYPYHSGGSREPFLCEIVQKDPNRPPQIDLLTLTPFRPNTSSTPDNGIPTGEGS